MGDLRVRPGGQDRLADARGVDRPAPTGAEEGAHRRMAFDLRNENHIAIVLDADIGGLAARFHQLFQIGPRQRAKLAETAKGVADLEGLDADHPVSRLQIVRNHAVIGERR